MLRPNTADELKIKEKLEKKGRFTRLGTASIPVHLLDEGPPKKSCKLRINFNKILTIVNRYSRGKL